MTGEILAVFLIMALAMGLFLSGRVRVDLVAMFVLLALGLGGLVSPGEAVAGFSNPAVITIGAIFVISGGLYRSGVANWIGRRILHLAGRDELRMVVVLMVSVGVLSFFMNTIAIVALMLPVVMDMARRTGLNASKLLMPLSFGGLLGGLTSLFATLPNLLAAEGLRDHGFEPFGIFDFVPVGLAAAAGGMLFIAFVGRHMLPVRDLKKESAARMDMDLRKHYALHERMFVLRLPSGSVLTGKSLAETRIGSALGLHVVAILRRGRTILAPEPELILRGEDRLLAQGTPEQMGELAVWQQMVLHEADPALAKWFSAEVNFAEVDVGKGSLLDGETLRWSDFRQQYGLNVLAIRRDGGIRRSSLQDLRLQPEDTLLVHGRRENLEKLQEIHGIEKARVISPEELAERYHLQERLFSVEVTEKSPLVGKSLSESKLGDVLGLTVMGIWRGEKALLMPAADETIEAGDRLLAAGKSSDLLILQGLKDLEWEREVSPELSEFESEKVGLIEAVLSPRTGLAGKTLRELNFREKYGLTVLGILRQGQVYSTGLGGMPLQFGDALLLYGPREKIIRLGREADFLVLTEAAQEPPRFEKAPMAVLAVAIFLGSVWLGGVALHLAAVIGAVVMILAGCLSMEEAYEAVDWRAIVLIAGMLPMGTALQTSGAANYLGEVLVSGVEPWGPYGALAGVFLLASLGTMVMPASALVVLMAPVAVRTALEMGISPYPVMMALALAASGSFNSPIAHPANLMIMGPGGYRYVDYMKLGLPLSVMLLVVVLLVVPLLWPF